MRSETPVSDSIQNEDGEMISDQFYSRIDNGIMGKLFVTLQ